MTDNIKYSIQENKQVVYPNDDIFDLSTKITCQNIQFLDSHKNNNIFLNRTTDCLAYANENGIKHNINTNDKYLGFDKYVIEKYADIQKRNIDYISDKPDCLGTVCNDDNFFLKNNNLHTYKNGLHYDCESKLTCSYHQSWHNIKGKEEIKQYINKADCFAPITASMGNKCSRGTKGGLDVADSYAYIN